jgi:hypothetical protein
MVRGSKIFIVIGSKLTLSSVRSDVLKEEPGERTHQLGSAIRARRIILYSAVSITGLPDFAPTELSVMLDGGL